MGAFLFGEVCFFDFLLEDFFLLLFLLRIVFFVLFDFFDVDFAFVVVFFSLGTFCLTILETFLVSHQSNSVLVTRLCPYFR